jgi:hypothetical protein
MGFQFLEHITNTQNQPLNVTFTTATGTRFPFEVPANSTRTFTGSNIPQGITRADFSTTNGNVSGRISVRVSNIPL